MSVRPVPRLERPPSPSEFAAAHVEPALPAVLTGAARDWRAFERWTPEHLRSAIGQEAFAFRTSAGNAHPADPARPDAAAGGYATFSAYLDMILAPDGSGARSYLTGEQTLFFDRGLTNGKLAPLADDFEVPGLLDEDALQYVGFWVSARGVVSWLHYDANGCHNLNAQVRGRKRVRLAAPDQGARLYPYLSSELGPHTFSQVDVRTPDLARFPEYAKVEWWEAVLEPGDVLFLPAFWFHTFEHLDPFNVNVNFWWSRRSTRLTPTTIQWAFADAYARALAQGRSGLPAAVLAQARERLPPEARAFCAALEKELLRALDQDEHRHPADTE